MASTETKFYLQTQIKLNGEHTYYQKWHFDKMPKIDFRHSAEFFLQNDSLLQNAENLFIIKISKVYDYLFIL